MDKKSPGMSKPAKKKMPAKGPKAPSKPAKRKYL